MCSESDPPCDEFPEIRTCDRSPRISPVAGFPIRSAAAALSGPITVVLDNARYQRNAVVHALTKELGITLPYQPSCLPNLNLIERLWKFTKRRALYGRCHPTFAEFRAAIEDVLDGLSTTHDERLTTLMTLELQLFEEVSLMAAPGTYDQYKHAQDFLTALIRTIRTKIIRTIRTHQSWRAR